MHGKAYTEAGMTEYAKSADGVKIAYTAAGEGDPALVFIHGGLADRTFWSSQMEFFSGRHKVIALDLGGHGESGQNRAAWPGLQARLPGRCSVGSKHMTWAHLCVA